jgi:hypothetical protein
MTLALIKTSLKEPNHQVYNNNQQQQEYRETKTADKSYRGAGNKKDNSPHSDWSLHNNPPRELRNIIPEMPTQNMPAQPQSIIPLISQHRSHSCNIKSQS